MNAKPGDLVVCLNAKPSSAKHAQPEVKKGQIYKVLACTVTPGAGRPAYMLDGCEAPWSQTRFKKLDGQGDKEEFNLMMKKHKPVDGLVDA